MFLWKYSKWGDGIVIKLSDKKLEEVMIPMHKIKVKNNKLYEKIR